MLYSHPASRFKNVPRDAEEMGGPFILGLTGGKHTTLSMLLAATRELTLWRCRLGGLPVMLAVVSEATPPPPLSRLPPCLLHAAAEYACCVYACRPPCAGIAMGKSTVAAWLRELGVPVLDSDQVLSLLQRAGCGRPSPSRLQLRTLLNATPELANTSACPIHPSAGRACTVPRRRGGGASGCRLSWCCFRGR